MTVANLEENNNTQQATSHVETAEEVEQQQPTQQSPDGFSGIVITSAKSKKSTAKRTNENAKNESDDDGPLGDHFVRFDGEYYQELVILIEIRVFYSNMPCRMTVM